MTIRFTRSYQGWIIPGLHQPGDELDVDAPTAAYLCDEMGRAERVPPAPTTKPAPKRKPRK